MEKFISGSSCKSDSESKSFVSATRDFTINLGLLPQRIIFVRGLIRNWPVALCSFAGTYSCVCGRRLVLVGPFWTGWRGAWARRTTSHQKSWLLMNGSLASMFQQGFTKFLNTYSVWIRIHHTGCMLVALSVSCCPGRCWRRPWPWTSRPAGTWRTRRGSGSSPPWRQSWPPRSSLITGCIY